MLDGGVTQFKVCTSCGDEKSSSDFYPSKSRPGGLHQHCISCSREKNRAARFRNMGISEEQFDLMILAQEGVCAICKMPPVQQGNVLWAIDHDHGCCPGRKTCGKCVRGLLCSSCNRGIGMFDDDPDRLMFACEYLVLNRKSRRG